MWQETPDGLYKEFTFDDFRQAFAFMQQVAEKAEELQHHPKWTNEWNTVSIWLYTHDQNAITDRDYELARAIDSIIADMPST